MSRAASQRLLQLTAHSTRTALGCESAAASAFGCQQLRYIGGDKVPEFWGKPSPYTAGTQFLGTPKNHLDLINKRPLSPDVLEIDHKSLHYQLPWGAISSITNRITGTALSVGFAGIGFFALRGGLDSIVATCASTWLLSFPLKFLVAYTVIYHWAGGMRHFVWQFAKMGDQADRTSLLEVPKVEISSKALLIGSAVLAVMAALM